MASSSTSDSLEFHPAGWQSCSEHISGAPPLGPGEDVEETKTRLWAGLHILIQHRRQWEHFDGTKIRFGSKHSLGGGFWWVPLRLMIPLWISQSFVAGSQVPSLSRFAPRLERQGIGAEKNIGAFWYAGAVPWCPFLGRERQSPAWDSWAIASPNMEPASGGVDGAEPFRSHREWEEILFSWKNLFWSPITGNGFGHGVPLSLAYCPRRTQPWSWEQLEQATTAGLVFPR